MQRSCFHADDEKSFDSHRISTFQHHHSVHTIYWENVRLWQWESIPPCCAINFDFLQHVFDVKMWAEVGREMKEDRKVSSTRLPHSLSMWAMGVIQNNQYLYFYEHCTHTCYPHKKNSITTFCREIFGCCSLMEKFCLSLQKNCWTKPTRKTFFKQFIPNTKRGIIQMIFYFTPKWEERNVRMMSLPKKRKV